MKPENKFNPHALFAVLLVCDAAGGHRLCINEVLTCLKAGKAPRGYVHHPPSYFPSDSLTRFVPEGALCEELYDLQHTLMTLSFLDIKDEVSLAYLLFLLDYGYKKNPLMSQLNRIIDHMEKEGATEKYHKELAVNWLFEMAKQYYTEDTRDVEQEAIERQQWAEELASLQVLEREEILNPYGMPAIFDIKDKAGYSRPTVTSVLSRFRSEEHISGFVDNPYKEMHVCRYLRKVPEYALTGAYNLPLFWKLLKENKLDSDPYNVMFLLQASDWGRMDTACMKELLALKEKFYLDKPFLYIARQLEKHEQLLAGGRHNRQIIREMKARRQA